MARQERRGLGLVAASAFHDNVPAPIVVTLECVPRPLRGAMHATGLKVPDHRETLAAQANFLRRKMKALVIHGKCLTSGEKTSLIAGNFPMARRWR
jgi:hypothetical protein